MPRSATWLRAFALLAVLGSVALLAQTPAKFDKAALTKYVLYLERWPEDAQVTLSDPKPAADLPGLQEVVVERTRVSDGLSRNAATSSASTVNAFSRPISSS